MSANTEILTGTAMLSAMWSTGKQDVLEAIMPFMRYSIGKETRPGQAVDTSRVCARLNAELGYEQLPSAVATVAMKRLRRTGLLRRERGRYYLEKNLDDDIRAFEERRSGVRLTHEVVGRSLADYLNRHFINRRFSEEEALDALMSFFGYNSLLVARNPREIEGVSAKGNKTLYHVGQFILDEYYKESSTFSNIEDMAKGFFVSNALFTQPTAQVNSKFKDTLVLLDTRTLIQALGFQSQEELASARQLLEMLREQEAGLACFDHTVDEIKGVLRAYKNSLIAGGLDESHGFNTLEGLDMHRYGPSQVDLILVSIEQKLQALGIKVIEAKVGESEAAKCTRERLTGELSRVRYGSELAFQRDIDSVMAVVELRGDRVADTIERCVAVFVTSNAPLRNIAKKHASTGSSESIPPVLLDVELGATLWLKSYAVHGDYPRKKLVEDATVALMPTESIMRSFFIEVDLVRNDGKLLDDEYAALKAGLFQRRELMQLIDADESNISEQTVLQVAENLRTRLRGEDLRKIEAANREIASYEAARKADVDRAYDAIRQAGEDRYNAVYSWGERVVYAVLAITAVASVVAITLTRMGGLGGVWNAPAVLMLALDVLGAVDLMLGKRPFLLRLVSLLAQRSKDGVKERKRLEYSQILSESFIDERY